MSFMTARVVLDDWLELDGPFGTEWVPLDILDREAVDELLEQLDAGESVDIPASIRDFFENKLAFSAEIHRKWYGARLSASGYMDCTPWTCFKTEEEAWKYLEEDEEICPDCHVNIIEDETTECCSACEVDKMNSDPGDWDDENIPDDYDPEED